MSDSIKVTENVVLQNSQKDRDSQAGRSKLMLIGGPPCGPQGLREHPHGAGTSEAAEAAPGGAVLTAALPPAQAQSRHPAL